MVDQTQIRSAIQTKIFDKFGKSVTLKVRGTPTYDDYGSIILDNWTDSTITVVPYDINEQRLSFERFGNQDSGDVYLAVPYTTTINQSNRIVMEGDTFEVKEVVKHYLPDNLVTIVRCAKVVA